MDGKKGYTIKETWKYGSLRCKVTRDLGTGKILYVEGNPDVAELVDTVFRISEAYHKLLERQVESTLESSDLSLRSMYRPRRDLFFE